MFGVTYLLMMQAVSTPKGVEQPHAPAPVVETMDPRLEELHTLIRQHQVMALENGLAERGVTMPIYRFHGALMAPMPIHRGDNCSNMPIYVWRPGVD